MTAVTGVESAIVVDRLTKRYGDRTVVDDVSFSVGPGEIVALLGPNGAGKTTTVECLEGYRRPDGGSVRLLGADPAGRDRELRARVGLMLQDGGFDIRARPLETLRQYAAFHTGARAADELLALVGLTGVARTPYRRLSGGERQRLALAVALVGRPEVAILDEPTAAMDPEARSATRTILHGLRADGVAILLTSHDLPDVERLADRIVLMADGGVRATGTVPELAAGIRPRLRIVLDRPLDPEQVAALAAVTEATIVSVEPGRYEVDGRVPTPDLVATVTAWCATAGRLVVESRTVGGTLEEAYLELVGGDRAAADDQAPDEPATTADRR